MENVNLIDGILRCSRYSFGPNRLHYCGPDKNSELHAYIKSSKTDGGLPLILQKFETLFQYLKHIARINNVKDPFDTRVVEAYWLGNNLLDTKETKKLYEFLKDDLGAKKKMTTKEFGRLTEKFGRGAIPHHSFHVLNVWQQTGLNDRLETLQRMNECRISSGLVTSIRGPEITVLTDNLIYEKNKIILSPPLTRTLIRNLEAEYDIEQIKRGQIVSIHWGIPCEVITKKQAENLKKYTLKSIAFANQTI